MSFALSGSPDGLGAATAPPLRLSPKLSDELVDQMAEIEASKYDLIYVALLGVAALTAYGIYKIATKEKP